MGFITNIWKKITYTKALETSSGYFETAFFESVYRVLYLNGLSMHDGGLYHIYSKGVLIMMFLFVCSEIWYLFISDDGLDGFIQNLTALIIHLIAVYRNINILQHLHVFKRLAKAMESPYFDISTEERKKIMYMWQQRNERFLMLLLGIGTCTLAAWNIYPLVDDLDYNLPVAISLPYDYRNPILYPITYVCVVTAFNYTSYYVMVNDLIMQAYLMHLLCQYNVLCDCFENILQDCGFGSKANNTTALLKNTYLSEKFNQRLGDLVNQHKLLLSNTMDLRNILSIPMLFQFAASTMLICFVSYQVTQAITESITKFLMNFFYLSYNMFELFIFCRWCEEIKTRSEQIRQAVYCSKWECGMTMLPGVRSRIMLIIARATKPMVLSAGGLYELSLNSYATLVKTSYSALTILLRFRQD